MAELGIFVLVLSTIVTERRVYKLMKRVATLEEQLKNAKN